MTYPVCLFLASASDFPGIQAYLGIQLPVPILQHWVLAVCQKRMLVFWLGSAASSEADRASGFATCAIPDRSLPLMLMLTFPYHNLAAADCVVVSSAWVLVAELGSNSEVIYGKRVVLTDSFVGTEGTSCAFGPVVHSCLPFMNVAIWTLITLPPRLFVGRRLDKSAAKVSILDRMELALQQWTEQADVRASRLVCSAAMDCACLD